MSKLTQKELHTKLQSSECKEFLMKKLSEHLDWREKLPKFESFGVEKLNTYLIGDEEFSDLDYYEDDDLVEYPVNRLKLNEIHAPFKSEKCQGVVAGGALAAWLNEFIHQVPAVINDIDYFFINYTDIQPSEVMAHMYSNVDAEHFHYEIIEVKEEGVLNTIQIDPDMEFCWGILIESFDLSCCQVALNPHTQDLSYSFTFLDFLINQEFMLDIAHDVGNVDWPLTSIVRGQFKASELKAKFKIHELMQKFILTKIISYDFESFNSFEAPIPLYCKDPQEKYKLLCGKNPANLKKDFQNLESHNVEVITEKRFKLWQKRPNLLEPWISLTSDGMKLNQFCFQAAWVKFIDMAPDAITTDHLEFLLTELGSEGLQEDFEDIFAPKKKKPRTLDEVIPTPVFSSFHRSEHHFKRVANIINLKIFSQLNSKEFLPEEFRDVYTKLPHLFTTDAPMGGLETIAAFQKEHDFFSTTRFNYYLVKFKKYSINDLVNLYKFLSKLPLEFIGVMETLLPTHVSIYSNGSLNNATKSLVEILEQKEFKVLEAFLIKEYEKNIKKNFLVTKLKLPTYWNKNIQELNLASQLLVESDKMGHCIKGYSGKVKEGTSRVFHLKIGHFESTLELKPHQKSEADLIKRKIEKRKRIKEDKPKKRENKPKATLTVIGEKKSKYEISPLFTLTQHKAHSNKDPNPKLIKLASKLVNYLNNYNNCPE